MTSWPLEGIKMRCIFENNLRLVQVCLSQSGLRQSSIICRVWVEEDIYEDIMSHERKLVVKNLLVADIWYNNYWVYSTLIMFSRYLIYLPKRMHFTWAFSPNSMVSYWYGTTTILHSIIRPITWKTGMVRYHMWWVCSQHWVRGEFWGERTPL